MAEQSLAISDELSVKVIQSHHVAEGAHVRRHGEMARLALIAEQPKRALEHLVAKQKLASLSIKEWISMVDCLSALNMPEQARTLALQLRHYVVKPSQNVSPC